MEEQKLDRRVRRTKNLIGQALSALMQEKDLKDITVKDITERADINRGTFYLHYQDVQDLICQLEDKFIDTFVKTIDEHICIPSTAVPFPIITQLLDYVSDNKIITKAFFLSSNGGGFQKKFKEILVQKGFENHSQNSSLLHAKQNEYILNFLADGIMGILKTWFTDSTPLSQIDLAYLMQKLVDNVMALIQPN